MWVDVGSVQTLPQRPNHFGFGEIQNSATTFLEPQIVELGLENPQVEIDLRLNFPTPLGRCGGWYRLFAHETAHEKLMDDMRAEIDCINVIICGPAVVW